MSVFVLGKSIRDANLLHLGLCCPEAKCTAALLPRHIINQHWLPRSEHKVDVQCHFQLLRDRVCVKHQFTGVANGLGRGSVNSLPLDLTPHVNTIVIPKKDALPVSQPCELFIATWQIIVDILAFLVFTRSLWMQFYN